MTTTLHRLLKYPHADVFDKTPQPELALRVRHVDGAHWRIAEGILVVTAGGVSYDYDLTEFTVGRLADQLELDGFDIQYLSTQLANHGAMVLVEGEGFEGKTNGDHIYAYTSALWAIFSGYAGELRNAELQMHEALRQMIIPQSEGEWLDLWGALYATERIEGESDSDYAARIPEEAFRIRVNALAIEKAIKDRTGQDVEIREPWKRMFTLNSSALSGSDHLPDGRYYGYFLVHPVARGAVDWETVLEVIDRNLAAGIEVYSPAVEYPVTHVFAQPPMEYLVGSTSVFSFGMSAAMPGQDPLSVMHLDDYEITFNHPLIMFSVMGMSNRFGLGVIDDGQAYQLDDNFILDESTLDSMPARLMVPRSVAWASISLSDGVPLGDESAILSRGLKTKIAQPPEQLSEQLRPSDYSIAEHHERVERITLDHYAYGIEGGFEYSVGTAIDEEESYRSHVRLFDGTWTGTWDDRRWIDPFVVGMAMETLVPGQTLNKDLVLNLSKPAFDTRGAVLDVNLVLDESEMEDAGSVLDFNFVLDESEIL